MRHSRYVFIACLAVTISLSTGVTAQTSSQDGLWVQAAPDTEVAAAADDPLPPGKYRLFKLDVDLLKSKLKDVAPAGDDTSPASDVPTEITVPRPDGTFQKFRIKDSGLLDPATAARFPELRSFEGESVEGPSASIAVEVNPEGFSASVRSRDGLDAFNVERKRGADDASVYATFSKRDYKRSPDKGGCVTPSDDTGLSSGLAERISRPGRSGGTVRTYRLAMAATGEYTAFHGGTTAKALSGILKTVNRLNQIYQPEVGVRFRPIENMDRLIFTDAEADPFNNNVAGNLINQSQQVIDQVVGDASYDVGHTLSTGAGGLAALGSVGISGRKARGVTGSNNPIDDPFDVDYVAHEIGHQFGANHTFNGKSGSCSEGNRNGPTAYEPGSGTTILGYAGICLGDDVQRNSNPYFHFVSLEEIGEHMSIDGQPKAVANGNRPPEVAVLRPQGLPSGPIPIPRGTAFQLDAKGSDADNEALSYAWEQADLGAAAPLEAVDRGDGPLFRSRFGPSLRILPTLESVLGGPAQTGEVMPDKPRIMNFRVTARDGRPSGGAFASDVVAVQVVANTGPFKVTAPTSISPGARGVLVKWAVAKTDKAPINVKRVEILLSRDGGVTFPEVLAAATANDGSERVTLPPAATNSGLRIKVQAIGNIFFAVSRR